MRTSCWSFGAILGAATLLFFGMIFHDSIGSVLIERLEKRFPVRVSDPSDHVTGIILLGGFHLDSNLEARWSDLAPFISERVVETVRLARLYPNSIVLYSGGGVEAERGKQVLARLGIAPHRIVLEATSRSTAQNATLSSLAVKPKRSDRWVVVTSAYHMPRAIGAFRAAGFSVVAAPVDFRFARPDVWPAEKRRIFVALKEYTALICYRLVGRTLELFPANDLYRGTVSAQAS